MPFNHYAKLKRIINSESQGWYVRLINESTTAKTFTGEVRKFDHYYRLYDSNDQPIKYGKFQQIDKLAKVLNVEVNELPII